MKISRNETRPPYVSASANGSTTEVWKMMMALMMQYVHVW